MWKRIQQVIIALLAILGAVTLLAIAVPQFCHAGQVTTAPVQATAPAQATVPVRPIAKVDFESAYACVQQAVAYANVSKLDPVAYAEAACGRALIDNTTEARRFNGLADDPPAVTR